MIIKKLDTHTHTQRPTLRNLNASKDNLQNNQTRYNVDFNNIVI